MTDIRDFLCSYIISCSCDTLVKKNIKLQVQKSRTKEIKEKRKKSEKRERENEYA
jgi:hypothetical protein